MAQQVERLRVAQLERRKRQIFSLGKGRNNAAAAARDLGVPDGDQVLLAPSR